MTQIPAEEGGAVMGTRDEMFTHLAENRDSRCVGIPCPALGVQVMIRVSPASPADELFYDLSVMCPGSDEHEAHPIDVRELQTREEIEELLDAVQAQEMMAALMSAMS